MANVSLSFPNRFDNASVSGGAWSAALPASNLQTRQLAQVARSVSAAYGTYVYARFSAATAASVFGVHNHNLTTAGRVRVRAYAADIRPVYDVDFRNRALPSGWSLTRTGAVATYIGSDGFLKTAAANEVRWHHFGGVPGLLVEPAATNICLHARNGSNAAWTKTNCTANNTNIPGIDGGTTGATRVTATAGSATIRQTVAGAGVFSVWVRRVSGTGSVSIKGTTSTVIALTSSWQRFTCAYDGSSAGLDISTSGDVIEFDYAQVETGNMVTSSILTTTASVTRDADVLTVADGLFSVTGGSLALRFALPWANTITTNQVIKVGGSSANNVNVESSGGVWAPTVRSGNVQQAAITLTSATAGVSTGLSVSWATNNVRAAAGSTLGTPDTVATVPSAMTGLLIGTSSWGTMGAAHSPANALWIERITVFSTPLANAALQSINTTADMDPGATSDSGWVNAWPSAFVSGTTAEERSGMKAHAVINPGASYSGQTYRFDFDDAANPAGYIQLGRVFMGDAWSPGYNMSYGASIGYEARASVVETDSGAEYFVTRPNPRVARFTLEWQTESEAMGQTLEMQRQLGTTGEVLFTWDSADTLQQPRRTFLGRLRALSPVAHVLPNVWSSTFEVKELL